MNRFNYLVSPAERLFGITVPSSLAAPLRAPLATFVAAVAVVAAMAAVQDLRLHAAQRDGEVLATRVAAMEPALAHARELERAVRRAHALEARLIAIRHSGATQADAIARLGNQLPRDAWLTSVRIERNAIAIEGRGAQLASVGTAMTALIRLPSFTAARLLSVHGDPARAGVTYAIALEKRR